MSGDPSRVSVKILEKEYHVTCPPEERPALLDSAEYLNRKMREIRERFLWTSSNPMYAVPSGYPLSRSITATS